MGTKLVEFETAKLAMEKGFNEKCDHYASTMGSIQKLYYFEGDEGTGYFTNEGIMQDLNQFSEITLACTIPYQAELQSWIRDYKKINIWIDCDDTQKWVWTINFIEDGDYIQSDDRESIKKIYTPYYDSYEKALDEALIITLLLI